MQRENLSARVAERWWRWGALGESFSVSVPVQRLKGLHEAAAVTDTPQVAKPNARETRAKPSRPSRLRLPMRV
eukprot:scaffold10240_cov107-Isochrysis_galbana.AAC.1